MSAVDRSLVHGLKLLSLDAGNTIIFLDHARLAKLTRHGDRAAFVRGEGVAKLAHARGEWTCVRWSQDGIASAKSWGDYIATVLAGAGIPEAEIGAHLERLWPDHMAFNLFSAVPEGLGAALDRVRERGVKVVVVSNSEGKHDEFFTRLGIRAHFDAIVDSALVGVEKPDPKIFTYALTPWNLSPHDALHLGDMVSTDIAGARAAGLRYALIDPFHHFENAYPEVLRVPSVVAVCDAICHPVE